MTWTKQPRLECPTCGQTVEEISYTKKFQIINGVRYGGEFVWELSCCGAVLYDEFLDWDNQQGPDQQMWSAILDQNGNPILSWQEA